ncbi:hypothetical protein ACP70R_008638 [Stipagrostis hirtigluma subsp. patula]
MASPAVLQSAACRSLRRPLLAAVNKELTFVPRLPPPVHPRRPYGSDCVGKADELNKHVTPEKKMAVVERISQKFDKLNSLLDERGTQLQQIKELAIEMKEREERGKRGRVFLGVSVFVGLAMYAKQHFFG